MGNKDPFALTFFTALNLIQATGVMLFQSYSNFALTNYTLRSEADVIPVGNEAVSDGSGVRYLTGFNKHRKQVRRDLKKGLKYLRQKSNNASPFSKDTHEVGSYK